MVKSTLDGMCGACEKQGIRLVGNTTIECRHCHHRKIYAQSYMQEALVFTLTSENLHVNEQQLLDYLGVCIDSEEGSFLLRAVH